MEGSEGHRDASSSRLRPRALAATRSPTLVLCLIALARRFNAANAAGHDHAVTTSNPQRVVHWLRRRQGYRGTGTSEQTRSRAERRRPTRFCLNRS
ncbi:hypothetical protein BDA96_01G186700 [Sorghum bicolor]|uniref:Uncharacterized protein n=2 Tax=Sorghum bicolor TaxID=4558 RepID=A0A1B6QJJ3_SORBI|nr:hypothetical protein BDA96_01G186700 [Sorghum bicolor]KXG38084.1 hypothetical protein SORBI_3001G178200 [Sorghum bicolor]